MCSQLECCLYDVFFCIIYVSQLLIYSSSSCVSYQGKRRSRLFFLNLFAAKTIPITAAIIKAPIPIGNSGATLIEYSADSGLIGLKRIPYIGILIE